MLLLLLLLLLCTWSERFQIHNVLPSLQASAAGINSARTCVLARFPGATTATTRFFPAKLEPGAGAHACTLQQTLRLPRLYTICFLACGFLCGVVAASHGGWPGDTTLTSSCTSEAKDSQRCAEVSQLHRTFRPLYSISSSTNPLS